MIIIANQPVNIIPQAMHTVSAEGLNLQPEEAQVYPPANNYASIRDALLRLGIKATYRAIQSDNFVEDVSGWKLFATGGIEANEGTFRGTLEAGSIHIPDLTNNNSFHAETDGDSYWGCNVADWASNNDNANAYILNTGNAKFQNITLEGSVILKDLQTGSVVNGEYVDALAVGKLSAGSILSKAISLGVTGGTGDCYISGGVGLDYANWTANKGFILGLDDSDNDKAKFFIGDYANNTYLKFDGTNTDATGFRYIETLTTGENISAGNVLCVKPKVVDYVDSWGDSVVSVDSADTNYEGTTLYIDKTGGAQKYQGYVQLSLASLPSTEHILKAILRLKIYGRSGAGLTCVIKRVTSAWDASTITWNTKPTETAFADGDVSSEGIGAIDTWVEFDITQVLRKIKNADYTNYGFQLYLSTNGWIRFYDSSEAEADRPYLRVYELNSSDGKVYKADHSKYETSRFIAGIGTETKNTDEDVKVQTGGQNTNLSGSTGENAFVASSGAITTSSINLNRVIRLGTFINTNKILIEKEYSNLFIEKNAISIALLAATGKVIVAPDDAKTMRISIPITGKGWHDLIVSRTGITSVEQRSYDGSSQKYAKAVWSGNSITITSEEASTDMNYYFYR